MAVPVVNREMLEELEAMGFSPEGATRALHFSGNSSTEAAIDWLFDHQNDPDLDQMPRVSIDLDIEAAEPTFVTEEMTMRSQELQDQAEEKEKKNSQIEKEKERIRAGKELLEAKTNAEDNERKRYLAAKKAEKDEQRRARERILQKLQNDKLERRRRLVLPSETPAALKPPLPIEDNRRTSGVYSVTNTDQIGSVTYADQMGDCLRSLKRKHKDEDARVKRAFQTLLIYVGNVMKNPDNEKFRRIRLSNPAFQSRVGSLEGGVEFLELCGFEKTDGGKFLFLPRDKVNLAVLNLAGTQLKSALDNPFFGLLQK